MTDKEKSPQNTDQQKPTNTTPPSRGEIAKEIGIGFLITLICNLAGMYMVSNFSDLDTMEFFKVSFQNKSFPSIVGLGAIANFLAFFVFLKKGQYYRVRGVLFEVILAALVILAFKFKYGWM